MFTQKTINTLTECTIRLETLLHDETLLATENHEMWKTCYQGLKLISQKHKDYERHIITAVCFAEFLTENIEHLLLSLQEVESGFNEAAFYKINDAVFSLTEEVIILAREYSLRNGYANCSEDEKDLLAFFEKSGFWFLGDGTMVSEYYYVIIPTSVISDFVNCAEKKISAVHCSD